MERPLRDFRDSSVKWLSVGRWETGTGVKSLVVHRWTYCARVRLFLVLIFELIFLNCLSFFYLLIYKISTYRLAWVSSVS